MRRRARAGGAGTGSGVGGVANEEREQTLNQLLTEMDGFEAAPGAAPVIVIAATNRPDALDAALRRPGRFDRTVGVAAPDRSGRAAILKVHLGKLAPGALAPGINADAIAAMTVGMTGAELANVVNEAALLAARRGASTVEPKDVSLAAERAVAGMERRSLLVGAEERRIVAIHECGHAIVGRLAPASGSSVTKVSVIPRAGGALGVTLRAPSEDRYLASEGALRGTLATLMGGRAAERVILGALTSGASDDIRRATSLATDMVASYGMSTALGPRALAAGSGTGAAAMAPGAPPGVAGMPSLALAARCDEAIDALLRGADAWAAAAVAANAPLLNEMAAALLAAETLEGSQLEAFLRRAAPPAGMDAWLREGRGLPAAAAMAPVGNGNGH